MDKAKKSLKNKIASAYSNFVLRLQKGYPLKESDYSTIKEAIFTLEYIEQYDVPDDEAIKIIDYYLLKLSF